MSRYLELSQATNDLVYSELHPPNRGVPPNTADEDATVEENAREFYRFELALPAVSGMHDQLLHYAKTNISEEPGSKPILDLADQIWCTVEEALKDEARRTGSKIQANTSTDNDSEATTNRLVDSAATTGLPDQSLLLSLRPTSVVEWVTEVTQKTRLNQVMEWATRKLFSSPADKVSSHGEDKQKEYSSQAAEVLYEFLAPRHCPAEHAALLQLSGFGNSVRGNAVFDMFLSCSSQDKPDLGTESWHKTTCIYERLESSRQTGEPVDICDNMKTSRASQRPLSLSFSQSKIWESWNDLRLLTTHEKSVKYVRLETLLNEGVLKIDDFSNNIRKFRLAVQLASSLHKLYQGPWIQQEWDSRSIQFVQNGTRRIEWLDEAYVLCVFSDEWRQPENRSAFWRQNDSAQTCPKFFLSLAQLLVDIANGERRHSPSNEDKQIWFDMLADEVRRNDKNKLMHKYWKAIENCLLYSAHDKNERNRNPDEKQRAQEIIKEHIVRYLQDNLDVWERHTLGPNDDSQSSEERSPYHLQVQGSETRNLRRIATRQHPGYPRQPAGHNWQSRQSVEPEFTLWSTEEDDWEILDKPIKPSDHSFDSYMGRFRDAYIAPLPKPPGDTKVGQRVRIAVLDSGLLQNTDDMFLQQPRVMERIIRRRNFFSPNDTDPDPEDWKDKHGHGTQVARLLLRYAPRADIIIAKICDSKSLKITKKAGLLKALEWAIDEDADIINLSFGLGSKPDPTLAKAIKEAVGKNKLIFAAASNTGQYGSRAWPATATGVFAIHATNDHGTVDTDLNPQPSEILDNFATFGCNVVSFWDGQYRSISGTSFATPIAAAIAANIVEFIRRKLPDIADQFTKYSTMKRLFKERMTPDGPAGSYHILKPWVQELWSEENDIENVCRELHEFDTFG